MPAQHNKIKWSVSYSLGIITLIFLSLPPVMEWFHQSGGVRWLHILLISCMVSFVATPPVKYAAFRFAILDNPDARKVHVIPTPLMGGIGIYLGFLISTINNAIFSRELFAIVIGATIVFISGLLDDAVKLSSRIRLLLQFFAVTILLANGISIIIFEPSITGIILNSLLTYVWIIGLTNSMNFFDGMDGMATGLSLIISFFIGIVAFQTNQPFLGWLAVAIMGAAIGFLPYNFGPRRPAEIFLGDSGSNFLGFTLSAIAVMGEWAEKSMVSSLVTPVLIFSILIYDLIYVTVNRIATGKVNNIKEWLDYVGKDHLHHRIANLLGSKRKSVLFIYFLSFTMALNALLLRTADAVSSVILLFQATCILVIVTITEIAGNKTPKANGR